MKRFSDHLASCAVKDVLPHIFKRTLFTVGSDDTLADVGFYLALEGRVYFDGLPVRLGETLVGRIASYFVIKHALKSESKNWIETVVSEVMDTQHKGIDSTEPLANALAIFECTKIGFVPISTNGKITGVLSVRDLLRLVPEEHQDKDAYDCGSPIISVDQKTSLGDAMEIMFRQGIRNLVIIGDKKISMVNDRNILDYLLSGACASEWKIDGKESLYRKPIASMHKALVPRVARELSLNDAASRLSSYDTTALIVGNDRIVSPWDLTMK